MRASERDGALDTSDRIATNPDLAGLVLRNVNLAISPQACALGRNIAGRGQAFGHKPLRQAGIEATRDRVFVEHKIVGKKPHFNLRLGTRYDISICRFGKAKSTRFVVGSFDEWADCA